MSGSKLIGANPKTLNIHSFAIHSAFQLSSITLIYDMVVFSFRILYHYVLPTMHTAHAKEEKGFFSFFFH